MDPTLRNTAQNTAGGQCGVVKLKLKQRNTLLLINILPLVIIAFEILYSSCGARLMVRMDVSQVALP